MDFSIGQPTTGRGNRGTISVRRSIEVTGEKTQFYSEVVSIPLLPFNLDDETFNERNDCGPIVPNSLATATPQSEDVDSPSSSGSQRLLSDVEDSTTSLAFGTDALDTLHGRRSPHQQPQWARDHAQNQHQLASKLDCEGSDCFSTSINLQSALDLTASTGIWGRDLTAAHPSSEMTETGVVPIHHEERFNCRFELDNIKLLWRRASGSFDLIQGRGLLGNIRDWGALCRNVFSTLRPGGHFELSHLSFRFSGKCGPLDPCHVWSRVSEQIRELGRLEDCSFDAKDGGMSTACIESASFQDIHESRQVVPVTACLDYVLQYIERALLRKWKWDYVPGNRAKEHLKWVRRDLEKEAVGVYTECVKIRGHKPNLSQPIPDDVPTIKPWQPKPNVNTHFLRQASAEIWSDNSTACGSHYRRLTSGTHTLRVPIEWAILLGDLKSSPPEVRSRFWLWLQFLGLRLLGECDGEAAKTLLARDQESLLSSLLQRAQQPQLWHTNPLDDHHLIALVRGGLEAAGGIEDSLQHCFNPALSPAHNLGLCCALIGLHGPRHLQDVGLDAISKTPSRSTILAGETLTKRDIETLNQAYCCVPEGRGEGGDDGIWGDDNMGREDIIDGENWTLV